MTTIRISLSENPDGSIHGYGGWVEMDGVRYRVSWDVGPDHRLQDGVTFEALLAAARAGQWLYVDDDNHWRIGD
ncbi:hypothetical protein THSYN_12000 [Candidatus Thiodictyon syntrophicum]|uniref:Uncharacterized protein n=2 Tax=Candidatus Thiodictyon syntrophicum TaxID=1166950 RepID=A0A2K8U7P8_9GAMM|nr:hypothetical protein THSYN_12000 [Candidatus Thiodictyon syntrophicum]